MTRFPRPEAITPEWLTDALRASGALRPDVRVAAIRERKTVGAGMLGDSVRFALAYDGDAAGAPASVVGKFPSADPVSRATGAAFGLYLKETRFYQELEGKLAIRAAKPFHADIDDDDFQNFVLILEDLTPARQGDQLTGCTLEDAELVIDQAVALHGPMWGDPTLRDREWLGGMNPDAGAAHTAAFPSYLAAFRERYDDRLEPESMRACIAAVEYAGAYHAAPREPATVQHLDFRLDNMLFEARGGELPLTVLDWQSVTVGPGVLDVTYFIGAGLPTELRREHERALFERWFQGLKAYGVRDYAIDDAWRDYRIHAMQGLFTAIFASVATKRTPRGDEMFLTMARRHAQQVADLDTLRLLDEQK